MEKTIEQRVADGAAFLDLNVVGWADKINLGRLNVGCICDCVLGQLYGEYLTANERLRSEFGDDFDARRKLGFMWYDESQITRMREIDALTAAWHDLILRRREDREAVVRSDALATATA